MNTSLEKRKVVFAAVAIAVCFPSISRVAYGGKGPGRQLTPIATLAPSDVPPSFGTGFGDSVAVWGDWIAVGAPGDPWYNGSNTGAVYVFRRLGPTWIEHAKLTDPQGTWPDLLGYSVAMEGDVIVAGAPHFEASFPCCGGPGAVYVFRRNDCGTPSDLSDDTWDQEARLTPPDPVMGDMLGFSVAISGDTILAGSPYHSKAEIYHRQRKVWLHQTTLDGADPYLNEFAFSLDVDGDVAVVGAFAQDDLAGAAYVFHRVDGAWVEDAKLTRSDAQPWDLFGWSVAIDNTTIVIGSPFVDSTQGSANVFTSTRFGNWKQVTTLTSFPSHEFGFHLALDGGLALIINCSVSEQVRQLGLSA